MAEVLMETKLPNLLHRGKVRDTFEIIKDDLWLMVTTDRISAFDMVLPTGIPDKGWVLNALSAFWFEKTRHLVPNHFLGLADEESCGLWDVPLSAFFPEITRQAMVVQRANRIDIECVVRGYITGSAWAEYSEIGTVSGKPMPKGMVEGDPFPEPLFTPTTKAEEGHDQNMSDQKVVDMVGRDLARQLEETSKALYNFARDYAHDQGIILADTKLEFGLLDGKLILIDELFTPDSSRFWDLEGYQPGGPQSSFDKQFVRDWLTEQGWNREPPAPELPDDIVAKTRERYLEAYRRLTGEKV